MEEEEPCGIGDRMGMGRMLLSLEFSVGGNARNMPYRKAIDRCQEQQPDAHADSTDQGGVGAMFMCAVGDAHTDHGAKVV